jgi:hypothetical protein
MFLNEIFIRKLATIDTFPACSILIGKVALMKKSHHGNVDNEEAEFLTP